jgi:hypothetical protein
VFGRKAELTTCHAGTRAANVYAVLLALQMRGTLPPAPERRE